MRPITNLNQISLCAIFRNLEYPEYPYSLGGTYFLIKYFDKYYVCTAKHVLIEKIGNLTEIRNPEECLFGNFNYCKLSLGLKSKIERASDNEDELKELDFDYTLIEVEMDDCHYKNCNFVTYDPSYSIKIFKDQELLVYGYPDSGKLQAIDYEDKHIMVRPVLFNARILEKTDWKNVYKIQFLDNITIDSLNGLSGSPVFSKYSNQNGDLFYQCIGMILRGTKESSFGFMISINLIIESIKKGKFIE